MQLLDEAAVSYQVVLTKCDKTKESLLFKLIERTNIDLSRHVAAHPEIMVTSSIKRLGISQLRAELAALAIKSKVR